MSRYAKIGYGEFEKIDNALHSGLIDACDLVIASDTLELVYIDEDEQKITIKTRTQLFENETSAIEYLNEHSEIYAGQPIAIKNGNNEYRLFIVQKTGGNYTIEPTIISKDLTWNEI